MAVEIGAVPRGSRYLGRDEIGRLVFQAKDGADIRLDVPASMIAAVVSRYVLSAPPSPSAQAQPADVAPSD